jgi:hypothetical protein
MRTLKGLLGIWIFVMSSQAFSARDIPSIAYDIMRKDLSEKDWKKYVRRSRGMYETWCDDNDSGDLKRFLDDRLLQFAVRVPKGKVIYLKRFIHWLSLYKEWKEMPPAYIREIADENRSELDALLADWSWDRAVALVKKKSREYDEKKKREREEEKRKAEEAKRRAREEKKRAERERKKAEEERKRAERERKKAEEERKRAERERKKAERERKRAEEEKRRRERR